MKLFHETGVAFLTQHNEMNAFERESIKNLSTALGADAADKLQRLDYIANPSLKDSLIESYPVLKTMFRNHGGGESERVLGC
jgi:hypothetical protein